MLWFVCVLFVFPATDRLNLLGLQMHCLCSPEGWDSDVRIRSEQARLVLNTISLGVN